MFSKHSDCLWKQISSPIKQSFSAPEGNSLFHKILFSGVKPCSPACLSDKAELNKHMQATRRILKAHRHLVQTDSFNSLSGISLLCRSTYTSQVLDFEFMSLYTLLGKFQTLACFSADNRITFMQLVPSREAILVCAHLSWRRGKQLRLLMSQSQQLRLHSQQQTAQLRYFTLSTKVHQA